MPPPTGRIYDRNRPEGPWATTYSRDNREESIYGLLGENDAQTIHFSSVVRPNGVMDLVQLVQLLSQRRVTETPNYL